VRGEYKEEGKIGSGRRTREEGGDVEGGGKELGETRRLVSEGLRGGVTTALTLKRIEGGVKKLKRRY